MKLRTRKTAGFLAGLFSLLVLNGPALAVPGLVSYQGKLTDTSGTPLEGAQNVAFRIYDVASGGTPLWSETQSGVQVTDGIYSIQLGAVTLLDQSYFASDALYLQVEIDNGSDWEVLTPRQRLTSTAFAFKAADAEMLGGKTLAQIHAEETDPTVPASLKDGVDWSELNNIPPGFADGLDADSGGDITGVKAGTGLTGGGTTGDVTMNVNTSAIQQRVSGACSAGSSIRTVNADGSVVCEADDLGITSESDPQVGTISTNYVPRWDGSALVTGAMYDTGAGRIGIGTTAPNEQIELTGNLRLPTTTATTGIIKAGTATLIHTYGTDNFFAGENAGNLTMTGADNSASGRSALQFNTTGNNNTASGSVALFSNTTGGANTANGISALQNNTTGDANTASGSFAGYINKTGSNNTFIGASTNATANNLTNATAIGYGAVVSGSNHVRIGNTAVTYIGAQVNVTATSDMRLKKDIGDIGHGLDFITALRPVQFRMLDGNDRLDFGFIAQDIEALLGEDYNILGIDQDTNRTLSLRYTDFIAPMVKAMQEQQGQIEEQQEVITELRSEIEAMKAEIAAIKAGR